MPDVTELTATLAELLIDGAPFEFASAIGSDVFDAVDAFVGKYVAYPSLEARHAVVTWIAHCWLIDVWSHTPRLLVISPEPNSGKTQLLQVIEQLCPHADRTAEPSEAYLRDAITESIEQRGVTPTLLIDEMDIVWGRGRTREAEAMRRLIDDGFGRHGATGRRMGKHRVKFPAYAAVAIGGNMPLMMVPATIRSRSVVIRMQRATNDELPRGRWDDVATPAEAEPLRAMLQSWATFVAERAFEEHWPAMPVGVNNRDADVWRPLLTVADLAGGHWPDRARVACVAFVASAGTALEVSDGVELLWEIRNIFVAHTTDRMHTASLLAALHRTGGYPWAGAAPKSAGKRLARTLADYAIGPAKDMRIGTHNAKGYEREWFERAWAAYPEPDEPSTNATHATNATGEGANGGK